jgi:transcriptional regulator with XRE-family HTH domain
MMGNRLREIRIAMGLTAAELGRRILVDPSIIRHVEAGDFYPYPKLRRRAARVLGVTEDELFPGARDRVRTRQQRPTA